MSAVGELVQGERRGRWLAVAVVSLSMLVLWAAPARATDYTIPGNPLTVYANDAGQLQVAFTGSATGEFYPGIAGAGQRGRERRGHARITPTRLTVYGSPERRPRPGPAGRPSPGLTGNGSAGNPYMLTINLAGGERRSTSKRCSPTSTGPRTSASSSRLEALRHTR